MDQSETDTFHMFGNLLRQISPSSSNGGKLSITECRSRPGAGAPPNRHEADDECFYVLSGQYEFVIDGTAKTYGTGSLVHIPNGRPHHFTNVGPSDATMLIITWPGRGHDDFFRLAGQPVPSASIAFPAVNAPPDVPHMKAIAARCGIELLI
jgi:quercetin dioxygenase-like cupin family protein